MATPTQAPNTQAPGGGINQPNTSLTPQQMLASGTNMAGQPLSAVQRQVLITQTLTPAQQAALKQSSLGNAAAFGANSTPGGGINTANQPYATAINNPPPATSIATAGTPAQNMLAPAGTSSVAPAAATPLTSGTTSPSDAALGTQKAAGSMAANYGPPLWPAGYNPPQGLNQEQIRSNAMQQGATGASQNQQGTQGAPPVSQIQQPMNQQNVPPDFLQPGQTYTQGGQSVVPQSNATTSGFINAQNLTTGQAESVSPNDPRFAAGQLVPNYAQNFGNQQATPVDTTTPFNQLTGALQHTNNSDFSSLYQTALNAGPDVSGADMVKASLQMQLGAISDPSVAQTLANQAARTQSTYQVGLGMVYAGKEELQEAINGTLTDPQTLAGAQAKTAADARDTSMANIGAQWQYNAAQQAATADQLQVKRADLEGYLKAQIAGMEGSDTTGNTAALTVMSQALHEADLNITTQQAGYTFAQNQLTIQGSQVMKDFVNNIAQVNGTLTQQQATATQDYNTQLNSIDQNALLDDQSKRQQTITAIGTYSTDMSNLWNEAQNRNYQYATLGWQKIQDTRTYANQVSGLTGTLYSMDAKGNLVDTGVSTLAFQQMDTGNKLSMVDKMITAGAQTGGNGMNAIGAQIEQLFSMPQGTLTSLGNNPAAMKSYVSGYVQNQSSTSSMLGDMGAYTASPQLQTQLTTLMQQCGSVGGQCGDWVDKAAGMGSVGNSYQAKMATVNADPLPGPVPGAVFVMPSTGQYAANGHIGIVQSVGQDAQGQYIMAIDSNYVSPNTVGSHKIYTSQISGYTPPKSGPFADAFNQSYQGDFQNTSTTQPQTVGAATYGNIVPPVMKPYYDNAVNQIQQAPSYSLVQAGNLAMPDMLKDYQQIQANPNADHYALDQDLVSKFNSMISTVGPTGAEIRPGLAGITVEGQSLPDFVKGLLSQVASGGKGLSNENREALMQTMAQQYDNAYQGLQSDVQNQSSGVKQYGIDQNVVNEFSGTMSKQYPQIKIGNQTYSATWNQLLTLPAGSYTLIQ